mgnify:CR=1 FL=1
MDFNEIKNHWDDIKPEWNEVKSTDWKAYFSGWMPKWKPWVFCIILLIGVLGVKGSVLGYEKTSDWAKQNSAETCSSARRTQGNYDFGAQAASLFCDDATIVDRLFKGIFSVGLLGGCLLMYHSRKREMLGGLAGGGEASADSTPEKEPESTAGADGESGAEPGA